MYINKQNNSIFIIDKLNDLKNDLNRSTIDINRIRKEINEISKLKTADIYDYQRTLIDPIKHKGVKIPSDKPVPSLTFQMHNVTNFFIHSTYGANTFFCNPWFLASEKALGKKYPFPPSNYTYETYGSASMYFYCNSTSYKGTEKSVHWECTERFTQVVPDIFAKYRVVSACLQIRYIGPIEDIKGVIGGGISFINTNCVAMKIKRNTYGQNWEYMALRNPDIRDAEYSVQNLIMNMYGWKEYPLLDGLQLTYFPLDESFEEYKVPYDGHVLLSERNKGGGFDIRISDDYFKPGFNWLIYIKGGPYIQADVNNMKIDLYVNYEVIPKPELLNYMPMEITVYQTNKKLLKEFRDDARKKAVKKLNNI